MISAMVMPLRPPKYAPKVMSTNVKAVSRNVVRRTLIGFPITIYVTGAYFLRELVPLAARSVNDDS